MPSRRSSVGTGELIRAGARRRCRRRSSWGSAAARRPTAAPACSRASVARPTAMRPRWTSTGLDPRLARCRWPSRATYEPTPRAERRGRGLRSAKGRLDPADVADLDRRGSSGSPDAVERRGRRASFATSRGPALRAASGSRCWPSVRAFDRSPCGPASSSSWRRPISTRACRGGPGHHRRRPDRCPDRVRQDGSRRRAAGARRRRAVHRGRRRRRTGGDRGACLGRCRLRSRRGASDRPSSRRWPPEPCPLERCGERLARLVDIGLGLAMETPYAGDAGAARRPVRRPARARRRSGGSPIPGGRGPSGSSAIGRDSWRSSSTASRNATESPCGSAGSTRRPS